MAQESKNLVFIVDDDPDDRQMILDAFLKNHPDLDYVFVDNAKQLLKNLHVPDVVDPDLILLDLNMPGIMGLQALAENTFPH
ncbi:MAG TPA: response regulator [Chitinophagaceae bacterium]|jgi:CheY-like chemotaxis protein